MSQDRRPQSEVSTVTSTTLAPPPNHTAASLVARHGEVDRATIAGFVWGVSTADLFARGQRVSTARVVDDGVAMLGDASDFLLTATADQKALVASVDGAFLGAASSALRQAEVMGGRIARRQTSQRSQRKATKADTSKVMTAGRARREVYRSNLIAQCGDDAGWKGRIENACGAVSTPAELADSFDVLANEGRALITHLAAAKHPCALGASYPQTIAADAAKMRDGSKAGVGSSSKLGVRKGDLDWWEGVSLWFLKAAFDVFAKAHAVDPSIPKLSPGALRSTLTPNTSRKRKVAAPPVPPRPIA